MCLQSYHSYLTISLLHSTVQQKNSVLYLISFNAKPNTTLMRNEAVIPAEAKQTLDSGQAIRTALLFLLKDDPQQGPDMTFTQRWFMFT